ncbi:mitochondrial inner membrane protease ATP23 homolog [Coccinella septempunctata]|uniref:mitochondrial inner membrane protease ATP23 homolog n=1 Tax=Coccinella septempunctata TaxID=41139 RepID=UPI001D06AFBE|nr:mitochondrial inner membrane protease ATP23 homolog [Coccinella septempunctata]
MTLITPETSANDSNKEKSDSEQSKSGETKWGYDLYPERKPSTDGDIAKFLKGRTNIDKGKCEQNVYKCILKSPLVKLMMGALKKSGCEIDIRRHISCEECSPNVSGGYDPILNQVVVCQNTVTRPGMVQAVLTHEFIHMLDSCQNKLDFNNLEHLACTEIRAANLAHCSWLSAWINGDTSIFKFKETHQYCVKNKALSSIMAVRDVTEEEAMKAINKVFTKCYNDLEPFGRRIRRNSEDIYKVYAEGIYYGYEFEVPQ